MEIINTIIGLGASVMMPIIFFVVGLHLPHGNRQIL